MTDAQRLNLAHLPFLGDMIYYLHRIAVPGPSLDCSAPLGACSCEGYVTAGTIPGMTRELAGSEAAYANRVHTEVTNVGE